MKMTKEHVQAFFLLAGFNVDNIYAIENEYFPKTDDYLRSRAENPWFLVLTSEGIIKLGPRKSVFHIEWSEVQFAGRVTSDDVTSGDTHVHAHTWQKISEYLTTIRQQIERVKNGHGPKTFAVEQAKMAYIDIMCDASEGTYAERNERITVASVPTDDQSWEGNSFEVRVPQGIEGRIFKNVVTNVLQAIGCPYSHDQTVASGLRKTLIERRDVAVLADPSVL